jgi:hypothetical protein
VAFSLDFRRTKREHASVTSHGIIARIIAMSASSSAALSASPFDGGPLDTSPLDNNHYEQACDQAIAMCDGNLRSTIKALIMANEYLEAELMELQAAISSGCMPKTLGDPASNAA